MKLLLIGIIVALIAGIAWFYVSQYEPLEVASAVLTEQNESLSSANVDAKAQIASLNAQIRNLNDAKNAESAKLSQLTSQPALLTTPPRPVPANTGDPHEYVPPAPLPAKANWTWTVGGRDYHNVVITQAEADMVHVTFDGGLGTINTSDLSPEIQKMLNYDPTAAAQASQRRAAEQAEVDAYTQRTLSAQSSQSVAQKAASLRIEEQKLSQLKANVDSANYALMKATTHVNKYGVTVSDSDSRDKDGGNERAASTEILQGNYESAKAAYDAELQIIADLQR